jgi:hypothetical protein
MISRTWKGHWLRGEPPSSHWDSPLECQGWLGSILWRLGFTDTEAGLRDERQMESVMWPQFGQQKSTRFWTVSNTVILNRS